MASAIVFPISGDFAEIVATCSIEYLSSTGLLMLLRLSTTFSTAFSIPLFSMMGLAPAVTFFKPSLTKTWAKSAAVVVPSPALSCVLVATSLTN